MGSLPFLAYPGRGRRLLGQQAGANCRHDYGLTFARITGITNCSYCGVDLRSDYRAWLAVALDHAVPASVCRDLGIPVNWANDYANRVLACSACNSFDNRYRLTFVVGAPATLDEFFDLRDKVFQDRVGRIRACHDRERRFYEDNWRDATLPNPILLHRKSKVVWHKPR
ncbi:MAG: hypothetical protein ABSH28_17810 [Acidobacteriota bacterium]|jgi:hypothetical protein